MDAETRQRLVVAMIDLGWSQADADEWDELFGPVVAAALAQAEREREDASAQATLMETLMDLKFAEASGMISDFRAKVERLTMEARIHAGEARAQRATVHEIYQLVSGGKGEPGDWNGAEPVRALMADLARVRAAERARAVAYLRVLKANHPHLAEAYEHAALNLQAALETDWQPDEARAALEGRG